MDPPLLQSDALLAVFASMDEVAFTIPQLLLGCRSLEGKLDLI